MAIHIEKKRGSKKGKRKLSKGGHEAPAGGRISQVSQGSSTYGEKGKQKGKQNRKQNGKRNGKQKGKRKGQHTIK